MSVSPQETSRRARIRAGRVGGARLQLASTSTRLRGAIRPAGQHGEEDTEAEHHQQCERGHHRGEICEHLRHGLIALA